MALAATACITHLKHTTGSVITRRAGRHFSAWDRLQTKSSGMGNIARQRDIIDRRALTEQLSVAARSANASALDRGAFVAPLRMALTAGCAEIRRRF